MNRESLLSIQGRLSEVAIDVYRRFADVYDDSLTSLGYATPARVAALFPELFSPKARVLEVGAGTGWLGRALKELGNGYHLVGSDISPDMLERIPAGLYEELRCADASQPLPWPPESFDGVVALGVSEYMSDFYGWFSGVAAVVRPGGRWIFTIVPCSGDVLEKIPGRTMILRHPPQFARDCLDQAGFAVDQEEVLNGYSHNGQPIEHLLMLTHKR